MINIENLKTLRNLLDEEENVKLNMLNFHTLKNKSIRTLPENLHCSCVCLIGYAAYCGIGDVDKYKFADAFNYSSYSFAILVSEDECRGKVRIWDFLFSLEWSNSVAEAIARLDIVINGDYMKIKMGLFRVDYDYKYANGATK